MRKIALLAFAFLGVIWGSNFIFVKWAAEAITPGQIVLLRVVFGFLPVFLYALSQQALRWEQPPRLPRHDPDPGRCRRPAIRQPTGQGRGILIGPLLATS